MATSTIQQLNRDLADKVLAEAKSDPQAYPGKYVGIANGKVVVATDDLNDLVRRLDQVETDARKTFIVEPGLDTKKTHESWGLI